MTENADKVLAFLTQPDRHEKNILKMCEEMAELSEVLLKYVNKSPENRPSMGKIVEESGDVLFRLVVLIEQFDIEDAVDKRCDEKADQIYEHYKDRIDG